MRWVGVLKTNKFLVLRLEIFFLLQIYSMRVRVSRSSAMCWSLKWFCVALRVSHTQSRLYSLAITQKGSINFPSFHLQSLIRMKKARTKEKVEKGKGRVVEVKKKKKESRVSLTKGFFCSIVRLLFLEITFERSLSFWNGQKRKICEKC